MEKLAPLLADTKKALAQIEKILKELPTEIIRDASIQRFEFTFELFRKLVKAYLLEIEGIDCNSPKSCFRGLLNLHIADADEVELLLNMTDHRNLTSHLYAEETSNEVFAKIPEYFSIMNKTTIVIDKGMSGGY